MKKDIRLLGAFVEIYCTGKHGTTLRSELQLPDSVGCCRLCPECNIFLEYAIARRIGCPLEEEKPTCKNCRVHCYAPRQREKVREIMAYSGKRLIVRGRLDYLWHYFF